MTSSSSRDRIWLFRFDIFGMIFFFLPSLVSFVVLVWFDLVWRSFFVLFDVSFGTTLVLLGFSGFYRVLPSFNGFDRVLQGFTGFYRVLLGFTGFYWL